LLLVYHHRPTLSFPTPRSSDLVCDTGAPIDVVHAWQLPAGSWGATLLGQARFPWSTVRDAVLSSAQTQADRLTASQKQLGRQLRSEEHTSELQSLTNLVCRLLL